MKVLRTLNAGTVVILVGAAVAASSPLNNYQERNGMPEH